MRLFGIELDESVLGQMREAADAAEREREGWRDLLAGLPPACRPAKHKAGPWRDSKGDPLPDDGTYVAARLRATADFINRRRRGVPFGGADPVTGFPGWAAMSAALAKARGSRP